VTAGFDRPTVNVKDVHKRVTTAIAEAAGINTLPALPVFRAEEAQIPPQELGALMAQSCKAAARELASKAETVLQLLAQQKVVGNIEWFSREGRRDLAR